MTAVNIEERLRVALGKVLERDPNSPRVSLLMMETGAFIESDVTSTELLTGSAGGVGGFASFKPSNSFLNLKKLFAFVTGASVAAASASMDHPFVAALSAMHVLSQLLMANPLEVPVDERSAAVLWTLWVHKDRDWSTPRSSLLALVQEEQKNYGRAPMSAQEFDDCLNVLVQIKAIALTEEAATLRERILISFK